MKLDEMYRQIYEDKSKWYCLQRGDIRFRYENLFDQNIASTFIKTYYFYDGNIQAFPWRKLELFDEGRARHTVSLFFLGIAFYEKIFDKESLIPPQDRHEYKAFLYYWFKICFYHDMGYVYEYASTREVNYYRTLDDFRRYYDISRTFLSDDKESKLISNYFTYRMKEFYLVDHGIAGGTVLYDKLLTKMEELNKLSERSMFYSGDSWMLSDEYVNGSALVAKMIAKHNMWFAEPEQYEMYEKYDLHDLIPKEDLSHRYGCHDYLLFILSLVDTMEPLKAFWNVDAKHVLEHFDIDFCGGGVFKVTITGGINCKKYIGNLKHINEWMCVELLDFTENSITLKII